MAKKELLDKSYDPKVVEEKWYSFWLDKGYFHASIDRKKSPFTIVIPPPNITGSLHMGHALNNTLQDIVIRKKRMEGYPTLWLPGTDHAGIATQNVVEQQLIKEGKNRKQLGREQFVDRVWSWKETYGNTINEQLKKLGCSCDWDRERFTFDEEYSEAVRAVFVKLYEAGLIHRGAYIINWCPQHQTALSDIEVEHADNEGHLWYIKYFIKDSKDYVEVATTRPETMLGDTAVAVNPKDSRYRDLIGKTVVLPLLEREMPIIADDFVDMEFGTGAVKVTPAHDPNDFEIGKRHDLQQINIFTNEAILNKEAGPYEGLDRYAGREKVVKDLEKGGYLVKMENHVHAVGHCYRCHTVVEPYLSTQWFVKMKPLAGPAIKAVREGNVRFVPEHWQKTYFEWMENIHDWCISRQLWWGHRIPVWYCQDCNQEIVSMQDPKECPECHGSKLEQDEDVLDTWFSSWLWPFATMGWPEQTEDLGYFYPTSLLSTGFDIIFFWVARMIMGGLFFMDEVPFSEVYIHALIRDAKGQKMSKSKGNVIDPLEIIEWSGTDALRFTLASLAVPGRDVLISEDRVEGSRHFVNKIWNASRFILMNLDGYDSGFTPKSEDLSLADRWILSRLSRISQEVDDYVDKYRFGEACRTFYGFFWGEFCDWYIEWSKNRLNQSSEKARRTTQFMLLKVLNRCLRLIHPVMPYATEEIWQNLPGSGESIMVSVWPKADISDVDEEAEKDARLLIDITSAIRQIRHDLRIEITKEVDVIVLTPDESAKRIISENNANLKDLARIGNIEIVEEEEEFKKAAKAVVSGLELFVPLGDLIDIDKEASRLRTDLDSTAKKLDQSERKLDNKGFLDKAPQEIVNKEKEKMKLLQDKKSKLESQLELLV